MRPLAIIERDQALASSIRTSMEEAGFRTESFGSGRSALDRAAAATFALVVLDLDVSDSDPFTLCHELSRRQPVVAFTNDVAQETRIHALNAGADDCLSRPFSPRELVARVRNVLRRTGGDESAHDVTQGEVSIALEAMRVRVGDRTYDLTRGETEVLALLVEHAPAPLTIARMLDLLPTASRVKRGTLESRIKGLRRKLGPAHIVSRGGFGYEFRADVYPLSTPV